MSLQIELVSAAKTLREACELFSFQQDRTASLWHAVKKKSWSIDSSVSLQWTHSGDATSRTVKDQLPTQSVPWITSRVRGALSLSRHFKLRGGILIVCLVEDIDQMFSHWYNAFLISKTVGWRVSQSLPETRRGTLLGSNGWLPRHRRALHKSFLASYHYHHLMVTSDLTVI